MASSGDSKKGKGVENGREQGGRYARYNEDQIEVLEKAFSECSNPDHFQRAKIMHDYPVLKGIDNRQLKVWFQNRRSRENQKKESTDIVIQTRQLIESNKLLKEVNDGLYTRVSGLECENEHLGNRVLDLPSNPVCMYANKAALSMLQTKPGNLGTLKMDRLFGGSEVSLVTMVPAITQQGYAILPSGHSLSSAMNITASYQQCVVWRVQPSDGSFNALALAFLDWAFSK